VENEIRPTVAGVPLHRSEAAKDVPVRVQNRSQSVRVSVAAAVKVSRGTLRRSPESPKRSQHSTRGRRESPADVGPRDGGGEVCAGA
jgi:hypothetical protein